MKKFVKNLDELTDGNPLYIVELIRKMESPEKYEETKDKIKDFYNATFGSGDPLNQTSIILMHYPLRIKHHDQILGETVYPKSDKECYRHSCFWSHDYQTVTLLTGDIKLDETTRHSIISKCETYFGGIVQIPHHGSWNNYFGSKTNSSQNFWDHFGLQVISYGLGNKYQHPNTKTVDDILQKDKILISVTQNQGFKYSIK